MDEAQRVFGPTPGLAFASTATAALAGADALLIATEWREFRTPDFEAIKVQLRQPLILDGSNLYEPDLMRALGIDYVGVGRGTARTA
jgi:UDPglucose 6-dehydrogenase